MSLILVLSIIPYMIVIGETRNRHQMKPFIVNGHEANITEFPYVAYLAAYCVDLKEDFNISWVCGASIINQEIILTAGHCVFGCTGETVITISVGHEYKVNNGISTARSYIVHEDYDDTTLVNDIALVRINTPLVFNATIQRIAIAPNPPYYKEGLVAGWGYTDELETKTSPVLLFTLQRVRKQKYCIDLLNWMANGTFCAQNLKQNAYTAGGDSGSPLVVDGYIQLGLVSGKDPDLSASVAVYTDVGYFYKWIRKNVKIIMCQD